MSKRNILVAGLGLGEPTDDLIRFIHATIQEATAKASEAGYDVTAINIDPAEGDDNLIRLREALTGKHYEAILIGGGVRGQMQLTDLFEKLVNLCLELSPGVKLGFPAAPGDVWASIQRVCGPGGKGVDG